MSLISLVIENIIYDCNNCKNSDKWQAGSMHNTPLQTNQSGNTERSMTAKRVMHT